MLGCIHTTALSLSLSQTPSQASKLWRGWKQRILHSLWPLHCVSTISLFPCTFWGNYWVGKCWLSIGWLYLFQGYGHLSMCGFEQHAGPLMVALVCVVCECLEVGECIWIIINHFSEEKANAETAGGSLSKCLRGQMSKRMPLFFCLLIRYTEQSLQPDLIHGVSYRAKPSPKFLI